MKTPNAAPNSGASASLLRSFLPSVSAADDYARTDRDGLTPGCFSTCAWHADGSEYYHIAQEVAMSCFLRL